jgi:hypothetical protein
LQYVDLVLQFGAGRAQLLAGSGKSLDLFLELPLLRRVLLKKKNINSAKQRRVYGAGEDGYGSYLGIGMYVLLVHAGDGI